MMSTREVASGRARPTYYGACGISWTPSHPTERHFTQFEGALSQPMYNDRRIQLPIFISLPHSFRQ